MVEFTNRTGHQIDEMIVQCEFGGQECTADDFEHVFTHQGNCFTFNGYKEGYTLHESKRAGAANGLKLVLDADTPEYTPSNDLDGDALDAGFRIAVHHNNEPPYVRELGLSIGPGVHSFITMQREHVTALPAPFTTCEESGNVQYYDHYSLQACRIECETLAVVTVCGCKLVEQPGPAAVCNASDSHECAHPTLVNFMNGQLTGVEECECQTPCDLHYYPIAVSSAKLRPTFIEKTFENTTSSNMSIAYISDNIAVTTIYYEALNMRKIDIVAATGWFDVLSSLGGNFGLFLGASLLTIVQFLEYLVDECMYTFSKKKKVEPDDEERPAENGVAMKVQDVDEPEKKDDAWTTEYS
ncbi:acid-sensing ion channel 4-A-like isoform X2 [Ptychodera flava]